MIYLYIIGGIFAGLLALGFYLSFAAGKQASLILKAIDEKYEDFVNNYIANNIVEQNKFEIDKEELAHTVLIVIKPEIESIIAHINATSSTDVPISYQSKYFKNIASIARTLFDKRHKTQHEISPTDESKLYAAFQDAIDADLTRRLVGLKAGNI
ncbi:MAG: hypothetical protein MUE85_24495 [Microscillaceae bacterium]|jgi:hypothetical protein|nr:hypothetical protein [Microscillaceae bacterium]